MVAKKVKKRSQRDALVSALEIQKRLRFSGPAIGAAIAIDPPSVEQLQQSAIGFTAIAVGLVSIPEPKQCGPGTEIELSFSLRRDSNDHPQKATGSIALSAPTTKGVHFLKHTFAALSKGLPAKFVPTFWSSPFIHLHTSTQKIGNESRTFLTTQLIPESTIGQIVSDINTLIEGFATQDDQLCQLAISQDGNVCGVVITFDSVGTKSSSTDGAPVSITHHTPQKQIPDSISAPFVMQARNQKGSLQWQLEYVLSPDCLELANNTKVRVVTEVESIDESRISGSERKVS